MRTALRALALVLFIGAMAYWAFEGANRGWTKTSVPKTIHDEVTGLDGVTYEKKFVPGVDFLAVMIAISAALVGVSFLFRTKGSAHASNEQSAKQSS